MGRRRETSRTGAARTGNPRDEACANQRFQAICVNMTDVKTGINPLFLREEELRQGLELLFFAYRDFTGEADAILGEYGFGRAHHRVIYFVGRNPGMTVSELLGILRITKQSLSRVLGQLVDEG